MRSADGDDDVACTPPTSSSLLIPRTLLQCLDSLWLCLSVSLSVSLSLSLSLLSLSLSLHKYVCIT